MNKMEPRFIKNLYLLGVYDLILSVGAIYEGIMMIQSNSGAYAEYPQEWLGKVPFNSWVIPGIIAITLFGIGNLAAVIFSLKEKGKRSWLVSAVMGAIFFFSLILQVIILGAVYLATEEFFLMSIIQLALSGYVAFGYRKSQKA